MAPVYDLRHVELDKIGRGKRIVKPPGGECSDIFGVQNGFSPINGDHITPRKANNYMQSKIFSPDTPDSPGSNGQVTPSKSILDTQDRLFGWSGDEDTPRRVVNRQRSSIFEEEVRPKTSPGFCPVRRNIINPITGTPVVENGTSNGHHGAEMNGHANGHNGVNGRTNGYTNGYSSPDSPISPMNGTRVRNPPGGKSSGIF